MSVAEYFKIPVTVAALLQGMNVHISWALRLCFSSYDQVIFVRYFFMVYFNDAAGISHCVASNDH
jgi:hypothetical protein